MNAGATKLALAKKKPESSTARRDELILEFLPLVSAIAAHIQRSLPVHIELDDLIHAGMMGLVEAAAHFQPEKQIAFPTYAKHRIRGAILDSLRQIDWASRDLRKRYKQMEALVAQLTTELQRAPTEAEVASAMGLSLRRWQALMVDFRAITAAATHVRSAERRQQDDDPPSPARNAPDRLASRSEMREKLDSAMSVLPERYRQVVKLYYSADMTMKEIGGILGVNESRVSQMHKSALSRMQHALAQNGISSPAVF
ncbi:MAG TPA: FliA/WhiG family RNA polymerase sigma factor [Bryobacteraceae bacterium]